MFHTIPSEDVIRQRYAAVARSSINQNTPGVKAVAHSFGYTHEDLAQLPAEANLGLGCGNPTALADLRAGEVVVDLGCGAGIDVLLAARRVGPTGKAIGIDMTPEMLERARHNAMRVGLSNVDFLLGRLEALPLPDTSADCLISNCVINLVPNKMAVFREMYRVLRPGGRIAISDIALKRPLPPELAASVAAWVGCIAGAMLLDEYAALLQQAGFANVQITDNGADLHVYSLVEGQSGCCSPAMEQIDEQDWITAGQCCCGVEPTEAESVSVHEALVDLQRRYNLNDYAASVRITACKPAT